MKIDQYTENYSTLINSQRESSSQGSSFSQILDNCLQSQASQSSIAVDATASVSQTEFSVEATETSPLLDNAYQLLDTLEQYAEMLQDPSATLKQISPLVEQMDQQAEELAQGLETEGNDEFSDLAWEVVTQARVEALKFQRGDYV